MDANSHISHARAALIGAIVYLVFFIYCIASRAGFSVMGVSDPALSRGVDSRFESLAVRPSAQRERPSSAEDGGRRHGAFLENDAESQMQRTPGRDERAGELEVGARVHEEPCLLLAEAEEPELVEAPGHDTLILEGELLGGW